MVFFVLYCASIRAASWTDPGHRRFGVSCVAGCDPSAARVRRTQSLTEWNRSGGVHTHVSRPLFNWHGSKIYIYMYSIWLYIQYIYIYDVLLPEKWRACLSLQEILDEVVRELHKVKDEIINGEKHSRALHCIAVHYMFYVFGHSQQYSITLISKCSKC